MDEPSNGEAVDETRVVPQRAERRWPMAVAVLAAVAFQVVTPHKGRLPGWWMLPILELALLGILLVVDPGRIDDRSARARRITIGLIAVMTVGTVGGVGILLHDILTGRADLNATDLLGRGAALWFSNVIVFSLWYWELDRGGPAERAAGSSIPLSFAFPENAMPEFVAERWIPTYPDYLYLAFTNATAFSPTDTLPVRTWAKMTMLVQSVVSLVTAILVIARAINVLPPG
ncbi:MAG: hypothetical protein ACXVQJ_02985 [Actinomycetota bacterium]